MPGKNEQRDSLVQKTRQFAYLLGLLGSWPLLFVWGMLDAQATSAWMTLATLAIILTGVHIARRSEGIGGALVAMSGVVLGLVTCMAQGTLALGTVALYSGPLLVAGAMWMGCWWLQRQPAASDISPAAPLGPHALWRQMAHASSTERT